MAPSKNPKQKKSASSPANTNTPSQFTTTATITTTTAPETAFIRTSDPATASELEPTSVPASEPASKPVVPKTSKKRSKKDASITTAPISTTTPATSSSIAATAKRAPLLKKTRTYGRKRASTTGKWDTPPGNDSTDGESGSTPESVTLTTVAARFTPSPIRGWNHATPESMAAAQGSSSRSKSRNSKGKSTTPPVSTATADVICTATNQNTTIAGTSDTAAATTRGTTSDGTNSPTPEFDPDATETETDSIDTDPNSGNNYTPRSGQNQTSRPRHPTHPPRISCRQQVQIINNISNDFSHDDIGMVEMNYPPNSNPTAGAMFPSVGPTLYSFPPHVWPSRFEDPSSRKRGTDGDEPIYPRMATFPPTLRPTSDFSPSSSSSAVTSVSFLSLTSSNLSSQPAPKKPCRNTRTNSISAATNATVITAATGAGQSSGRVGASTSATPTNGRGRGAASAAGAGTARQTAIARITRNTPKSARRYRTGLASGTTAQGNSHTLATASSSNNVAPGHSGQDHGNGNGNGDGNDDTMDADGGNSSGGSSTNNNVRGNSDNILRYGDGLVRRVGNQPIIAYSHTLRPGITPAEIGASLSLGLIRRREEAQRLREEEEQREKEERRRTIDEERSKLTQQAQQRAFSGTPIGQQESSSSSVPTSPSTQYTLTPLQQTPPLRQNPQQYPRNQNLLAQSSASSGNLGQNLPSQLTQYHAPIHRPGCHTMYQQPLQHYHQSSYSSYHHQSSRQYQPSRYQRPLQHPQHPQNPGPQNHRQRFNVHQSSSYQSFTHPYSSSNDYHSYNGYEFNGNYYNSNHIGYDRQYSNHNDQNYHFNNNHRNQQYNSYNNCNNYNSNNYNNIASCPSSSSSSSSSSTSGTIFAYPSQPYGSSRSWQGSLGHGPHPHPSSRRHIPFPPQLPDTLLANAHSHRYSTNTGFLTLTSPAPQPLARPIVLRNPGSPTQHQFPEYDQMTRASQAAFATLPPIRASAVQGPHFQASSNQGPTPVPVPMPFSHPSSSSSSGHSGNMQQQQQQDSARDGQSESHESGNDADDESSSGSA